MPERVYSVMNLSPTGRRQLSQSDIINNQNQQRAAEQQAAMQAELMLARMQDATNRRGQDLRHSQVGSLGQQTDARQRLMEARHGYGMERLGAQQGHDASMLGRRLEHEASTLDRSLSHDADMLGRRQAHDAAMLGQRQAHELQRYGSAADARGYAREMRDTSLPYLQWQRNQAEYEADAPVREANRRIRDRMIQSMGWQMDAEEMPYKNALMLSYLNPQLGQAALQSEMQREAEERQRQHRMEEERLGLQREFDPVGHVQALYGEEGAPEGLLQRARRAAATQGQQQAVSEVAQIQQDPRFDSLKRQMLENIQSTWIPGSDANIAVRREIMRHVTALAEQYRLSEPAFQRLTQSLEDELLSALNETAANSFGARVWGVDANRAATGVR